MIEVEGCMMRSSSSSSSSSGDSSVCNTSFENSEYFHGEEATHEVDEEIEIFSNQVRDTRKTETRDAYLPISSKGFSECGASEEGFGINYTPIPVVNVNEQVQMHVIRSGTVDSGEESDGEFSFSESNENQNMEAINVGIKRVMNEKGEEDPNFKEYIPVGKVHASFTVDGGDGFRFGDIPSIDEPLMLSSHDNPSEQTLRNVCGPQQALREIIDVYGSGMGDQEVLLLDGKFNEMTIIDPEKDHHGLNAIKEEDENDDDDDHSSIDIPNENLAENSPSEWETLDVSLETFDNSQVCTIDMDYNHALLYFQGLNLQSFESSIVTEEPTKSSFLSFGGSTKLDFSESQTKLKFPFLVACVNYDPFCSEHFSMLNNIYCKLIPGDRKLQPIDKCWENLGFQGSDPRTDLNRSMKCLSILQVLNRTIDYVTSANLWVDVEFLRIGAGVG